MDSQFDWILNMTVYQITYWIQQYSLLQIGLLPAIHFDFNLFSMNQLILNQLQYLMQLNPNIQNYHILPSIFPQGNGKDYQFFIIKQFLRQQIIQIQVHAQFLSSQSQNFNQLLQKVKILLQNESKQEISYENRQFFYQLLSIYNHKVRLNKNLEQLEKLQQNIHNKVLPPPSPCQYIDTSVWNSPDQQKNAQNWIGHGYYWKTGDGKVKDNYNGDYNTLEDKFYRIKSAKVAVADYQLLKKDFPILRNKSNQLIDEWLLDQVAYISEGQITRISPGGDLCEQLQIDQIEKIIDFKKTKPGLRYRGGGRAVNFLIDDKYKIQNGQFKAEVINVKGVGSQKIIKGFGVKQNGLLSLTDAIKQYLYQKLIQKIAQKENESWQTVQTYGFIDIGLNYKQQIESPATGYRGDRLALTIRQASSRFQGGHDQMCYYSVVPYDLQKVKNCNKLINSLIKWGVTCEQEPLSIINENKFDPTNLDGSWNIQSDATMSRFLDFSQFYVLPHSKLPSYWKISQQSLLNGMIANKFAFKAILQSDFLMEKYFQTKDQNKVKQISQSHLIDIRKKYGQTAGVMRKPKYSWSWFLETDDSQASKFTAKYGLNKSQKINSELMSQNLKDWLNF